VTGSRISRLLRHWLTWDGAAKRAFPAALFTEIEAAINRAEREQQCEIVFAVEASLKTSEVWAGLTPQQRARRLFGTLGVWDTEANNGVLLYVLMADRSVELVTDRGVRMHIADESWMPMIKDLTNAYKAKEYRHSTLKFFDLLSKRLQQAYPGKAGSVSSGENEVSNRPIRVGGD
jgi:uncharacterized membrane protein